MKRSRLKLIIGSLILLCMSCGNMVESVVSSAVMKLGDLLIQEVFLLHGVRDQVEWTKTELLRMQCFSEDANAKRRKGDKRVKNWVREVTDVAYRAEDVIDTFMLKIDGWRFQRRGFLGFIKRYTLIPKELITIHNVGVEIEMLKAKIREITESRITYGIASLGETEGDSRNGSRDEILESYRRISPELDDDTEIVGFYVHTKTVVKQLLNINAKRRFVASIVGMGGLGKTTLAKKVYNNPEIKTTFDSCRVWVTVSQDFQLRDLLKSINREAVGTGIEELDRMEIRELQVKLSDFLNERRYLIVMDDVWRMELGNVWELVKSALPNAMNGSRVLFTTRFLDVARSADPTIPPLELPLLNDDESWELFVKKAFPATGSCQENLEEFGRHIVGRCAGLPLALLVVGGLLSTKDYIPAVWIQVAKSMDWEAMDDCGQQCMKVLALSYDHLPHHHLKSCFLYIGTAFPEDSVIPTSRLVQMWIAGGFISQTEKKTMEDTARGYLDELAQRYLIQVVRRSRCHGGVSQCRIHDLFRDLCLAEAKQDGFLNVAAPSNSSRSYANPCPPPRRLALHNPSEVINSGSFYFPRNLRCLIIGFQLDDATSGILRGLKLLTVLSFSGLRDIGTLPKEIEYMVHLRYLDLGHCYKLKELPPSIGKLRNLVTLDLRVTSIGQLPKELGKLLNLRHLYTTASYNYTPTSMSSIPTKLQTLQTSASDHQWIEKRLGKLTNLRRLSLQRLDYQASNMLTGVLGNLNRLVALKLSFIDQLPIGAIITALSNHQYLHRLSLISNMPSRRSQQLPESRRFPPNLVKLTLSGELSLDQDPMPVLEKLPNLMFLELYGCVYLGSQMVCTAGGFPQLKELHLIDLPDLQGWRVDDGGLLKLTRLIMDGCSSLVMLPEGLKHAATLRELVVRGSGQQLTNRLRENEGEDLYKIQHVPSVIIG